MAMPEGLDEFLEKCVERCRGYDGKNKYRRLRFDPNDYMTVEGLKIIWLQQKGCCTYCSVPLRLDSSRMRLSVDRVANKFAHVRDNVQLACIYCNLDRGCVPDKIYRIKVSNWHSNLIESLM